VTDFGALLRALDEAGARFVIVGGAAAVAHGSARLTSDLDLLYERSDENLRRIVEALLPHAPYLRGAPAGLPFRWDFRTLRSGLNFTLTTRLGDLDLLGEIAGGGTYAAVLGQSIELEIFGRACRCLSIDQLIHFKRAAGRTKDLDSLAELEALRDLKGASVTPTPPGVSDMGPSSVMKERYGWTAENWRPRPLNPDVIPKELHDLIPWALRFGVSCDVTRHDVGEKSTPSELADLSQALRGRHESIWDFLYSFPRGGSVTDEASAFTALLLFEMEECGGPGAPGLLDYAIGRWRRQGTPEARAFLADALAESKERWSANRHLAKYVHEAERILSPRDEPT
jgi:hypothetical protein